MFSFLSLNNKDNLIRKIASNNVCVLWLHAAQTSFPLSSDSCGQKCSHRNHPPSSYSWTRQLLLGLYQKAFLVRESAHSL